MLRLDLLPGRLGVFAHLHALDAAGVEFAALGRVRGAGDAALEHDAVHFRVRIGDGNRGKQRLGVGVQGIAEDIRRRAVFHEVSEVHNAHGIGDMLHHGQVVGDEEIGKLILLLQLLEKVYDLRLDRHVQRRYRLVADHELRVQSKGPGNADALPLSAGELVGVAVLVEGLQAAAVHDPVYVVVELILRHELMLPHRLADDLAHGKPGGQARKRILEDDLHLRAKAAHLLIGDIVDLLPVKQHLAAGLLPGQAQDGTARGGLAAAGLAHKTHGGAAPEVEGHAVHRLDIADGFGDHAALDGEVLFELVHHQDVPGIVDDRLVGIVDHRGFPGFLRHITSPPSRSSGSSSPDGWA